MRRLSAVPALALTLAASAAGAGPARGGELVMFETSGCPWCVKWHREVGEIYPKTEEGQLLPLRTARLGALPRDLKKVKNLKYAPTFVVLECGRELGRIVGYQGDDLFWGEMSVIVARMKSEGRPKAKC
ncbi:thioredoxin family protein [Magnetospirillum sp. UT-4]|uniref:thioredoxin family protein n=1 Tax=Magnetospirillum sp. UT-4 TaxID=2681467 RepID=UPI0013807CDA|nr:thioredoxin family protein [Magnetospirillum sp. UT-4]CAA7623079.1 putative thioredoxin SoxS protein [Magnetospirillum sp. UT-4]